MSENTKHKLLIEFIYKKDRRFFNKIKYPVQNKPLRAGFRIKNIDDKHSPEGILNNIKIKGSSIIDKINETFYFPPLNPGQEFFIYFPDLMGITEKGELWVNCSVKPKDTSNNIIEFKTFQYDLFSKKEVLFPGENFVDWGNAIIVRGELEQKQAITNVLMFILTMLVFLDGVWGLDDIFKFLFKCCGYFFSFIGSIFTIMS